MNILGKIYLYIADDINNCLLLQVHMCQFIHSSLIVYTKKYLAELSRYNYVTPTSYLELLGIFSKLIRQKKIEISLALKRLRTGLDKVKL